MLKRIIGVLLFYIFLVSSISAATPNITNGTPVESFAGEPFCFDVGITNTGGPGFGPYIRLTLPSDISFDSVTYLGTAISTTAVGTFPASPGNTLTDPRSGDVVVGPDGGTLTLLVLPLGSVVAGGPDINTNICASLSTTATIGSPLDVTVQPVYQFGDTATGVNGDIEGTANTQQVTPTLISLTKTQNTPESERAPGPDFPFTYTINVDVANGQTVFDLEVNDLLPASLQFVGPVSVSGAIGAVVNSTPSTITPGGNLQVSLTNVTGTTAGNDLTISYPVYVIDVLDETNCGTLNITNNVTLDVEFPDNTLLSQLMDDTTVTAKHVPIQKGATPGNGKPGDVITFTLNFQVSDFGTADALVITDIMADGFTFGTTTSVTVGGAPQAITEASTHNVDGTTELVWDVHAVTGNLAPGTTGTITYTGTIDQNYEPGPDPVLASDSLSNTVSNTYSLTAGASSCSDGSGASIGILPVSINKSIVNVQAEYVPGDTITYRLTLEVPSGDTEAIVFEDYFPLPVFDVTSLNTVFGVDITFGPADTLAIPPALITTDAITNSLRVEFPNFSSTTTETIELDVNITVDNNPFADELFLTNLFQASTVNSDVEQLIGINPVQMNIRAPDLVLTKGISASSNPSADATISNATPEDSDISESDAGDTLTYVTTVENMGGAVAFDVVITDVAATGLTTCSVASVQDGDGTPLAFSGSLASGITLTNPLAANDGTVGPPYSTDTALITYNCTIDTSVNPRQQIENTASVTWASESSAVTFPTVVDSATVTIADPTVTKIVDNISPGGAGAGNVAVGDIITYSITVTLPEGTIPSLILTDALPAGFAYVNATASVDTIGFVGTVDTSPLVNASGAVATGQTLAITFNSPANTSVSNDNNASNNSFRVNYDVLVKDSAANAATVSTQNKTNTVSLSYTGISGSAINDSSQVDFAEADLSTTKTMSPDTDLDAGDTVTISIRVENNGTAPAYDLVVTDTLDTALFDTTGLVQNVTTPAGYTYNYADPTVTYTADAATSLAAGAFVTFEFTAVIDAAVETGSSYSNTATAVADSQDDTPPSTEQRQTTDNDSVSLTTTAVGSGKVLASSSETFTVLTEVAIGEILSFTASFDIPEGVTTETGVVELVTDTLPAGLQYMAGTALLRSIQDTGISGSVYGAIPTTDTAIVPVVTGTPETGQILGFDLGTVTNSDNDGNLEQIIISYDVLVLNTINNNRTDTKTNTISLNYLNKDNTAQSDTDVVSVNIGEPNLTIVKGASPTTITGGDTVTFTVVLTNTDGTNVTDAWNTEIIDDLDLLTNRYQNPSVTSATHSREGDVTACASFTGNILTVDTSVCLAAANDYLAPDETLTVVYTADIDPAVNFEENVDNRANATATSLPGSNGTGSVTPGAPDSDTGERTGSGNVNTSGQAVNDLLAMDDAQVTAGKPTVTKTGDANLQIGDITTHTVTLSVPVGTTNSFVLTDDLPNAISYVGGSANITIPPANFVTSLLPTSPVTDGTDPLVFDFGTVTNSATSSQNIVITYDVQVMNVLANQATTVLTNTATLSYAGASMPLPADTANVTVQEANLSLSKNITAGATGSDAGDTVSYSLTLVNTGLGTAYRTSLTDIIPSELLGAIGAKFQSLSLTNPADAVVLSSDGVTPLSSGDAVQTTTTNTDDTLTWPAFNMPPASSLTITYNVVIVNSAIAGDMLTNNAEATYNSRATDNGRQRDSSDGGDDDNDADLNNYQETVSSILTLDATLALQKTLNAVHGMTSSFAVGSEISYDLRLDFVEGITNNVNVIDLLPTDMEFIALDSITAGHGGISYNGTGLATESPTDTITINLGDITNPANADNTDDYIVLVVRARIMDAAANIAGATLQNSITATAAQGNAGPVTQDITVTEPNLTVTKVPDDSNPSLGDEVSWTVTVTHSTSTADAFDVSLNDVIPAGLQYVAGSTMGASVNESDLSEPVFSFAAITLLDTNKVFSFRTSVDNNAVVGAPITNTINIDYDSQPGTVTEERLYTGNANGNVTPDVAATLDAVKTVSIFTDNGTVNAVDPNDLLEYTIVITNTGPDTDNVVFTDPIPVNTSYVAGSVTTTQGTVNEVGGLVTANIGSMVNGDSVTLSFRVTVNGGTAGGTIISNQGSVDSDQTVPEPTDSDGVDTNGDQPTNIAVIGGVGDPEPIDPLYVEKVIVWQDDADISGDVTPNDTMRYQFVIRNLGSLTLTNVSLTDSLPAGLTYVAASAMVTGAGNNINVVGSDVSVTIPSLIGSGVVTVLLDVTIDDPLIDANLDSNSEIFTNQATADSDQTNPVNSDDNLDPSDGDQPTRFIAVDGVTGTPVIDVEKRWSLFSDADGNGVSSPNDTLRYTMTVLNSGSAPAVDTRLGDTIPANTQIVPGSVSTSRGSVVSEDPVDINIGNLDSGQLAVISFLVVIDNGTPNGSVIANQATVTANGGINEPSDDNGDDSDGKNPTLTPVTDILATNLPTLAKTVASGALSAPGDSATFRVTAGFSAGITRQVIITDTLPSGLEYIAGSARLNRVFNTGLVASTNPGGVNGSATGVPVLLTDGAEIVISGSNLSLILEDVINSDNDVNAEQFVLEYQVRVKNIPGNTSGSMLSNAARISFIDSGNNAETVGPVNAALEVIEPNLVASKVPSTTTPSLGEEVTWTVTVSHSDSTDDAEDVSLTDVIPAGLEYVAGSTLGASANESSLSAPVFGLGSITQAQVSKSFSFRTRVSTSATDGALINNTINLAWDSQSGTVAEERSYSDSASGNVTVDVNALLDAVKTVSLFTDNGTAGAVDPGDVLEYNIIITNLGSNETTAVVFTDPVPANTSYVPGSVSSNQGTVDEAGGTITATIGNMSAGQSVTVTFRVTVDGGTVAGTIISNQGSVDSSQTLPEPTDSDGVDENGNQPTTIPVTGGTSLNLQQPLYLEKRFEWLDDTDASTDITSGDRVRYYFVIRNLDLSPLNNVTLVDVIPTGLTYVPASATITGANSINVTGSNLSATIPVLSGLGVVSATIDVTIDNPLFDSDANATIETFINQATVDSDETDPLLSDGNNEPSDGKQPTEFTAVNGISGNPELDVEKRWVLFTDLDDNGIASSNDTLEYTITVANVGAADATDVHVQDAIPVNTQIVPSSVTTNRGSILTENPVLVQVGGLAPGQTAVIRFRVTIDNGTPDNTIIPNQAIVSSTELPDEPSDDNGNDTDGKQANQTPVSAITSAGLPTINKAISQSSEAASNANQALIGELVTYQLTLTVPAGVSRQVQIVDQLPAGLVYVPGSGKLARIFDTGLTSSVGSGGVNGAATAVFVNLTDGTEINLVSNILSLTLGDLINSDADANEEQYLVQYQAQVENIPANQAGTVLNNRAEIRLQDSTESAQTVGPASYPVTLAEPNLVLTKALEVEDVAVGAVSVPYSLVLENATGPNVAAAYDVSILDSLPAATWDRLVVLSIIPSGGASFVTDNSSGLYLDISIAEVPPGGRVEVIYQAETDTKLENGDFIENRADVIWSSLPGDNGSGAATQGVPGSVLGERDNSGGANDYAETDIVSINVTRPATPVPTLNSYYLILMILLLTGIASRQLRGKGS